MTDLRDRIDNAVETLTAGLADLTDPQQRLNFTELVLTTFLPEETS